MLSVVYGMVYSMVYASTVYGASVLAEMLQAIDLFIPLSGNGLKLVPSRCCCISRKTIKRCDVSTENTENNDEHGHGNGSMVTTEDEE